MVVGTPKVEGAFLIQTDSQSNPGRIITFIEADRAVAQGARLPAGITADAAIELGEPVLHPFSGGHRFNGIYWWGTTVPFQAGWFSDQGIEDHWGAFLADSTPVL
jgi:hypothetical protein